MSEQLGFPLDPSVLWEKELEKLYQKREIVSNLIDSLERYRTLAGPSISSGVKKPCQPSYAGVSPGAFVSEALSPIRGRRAG